jgi:hypothetical protein
MKAACWLMDRFGVSEALVGDLLEGQYRHRSRFRFWRQTIVAILNATRHDVLGHGALALRAVLVGWTLHWIIAKCRRPGMQLMAGWAWKVDLWLTRNLGVYIPVYFLIEESVGAIIIGWTVSRLHRPYSMLVYVATVQLFDLAGFFNSFQRGLSEFGLMGLAVNSVFPFVIVPLAMVLGGLLSIPHSGRHPITQ